MNVGYRTQATRAYTRLIHLNLLLANLSPSTTRRLDAAAVPIQAHPGEVLQEQGEITGQVYFPGSCVVSLLIGTVGRRFVEVGVIGAEGMVGISLALGVRTSPVQAQVQVRGTALRISAANLARILITDRALAQRLRRYANVSMVTAMRSASCNSKHALKARLARLLSVLRDRIAIDMLTLTHAALARMLGVRRVSVSDAAADLQRLALIRYSRGLITILDRRKLRLESCSCYVELRSDIARV
jgi:CRP-like cAMP-binding protein